jgi:hypothetical protein
VSDRIIEVQDEGTDEDEDEEDQPDGTDHSQEAKKDV